MAKFLDADAEYSFYQCKFWSNQGATEEVLDVRHALESRYEKSIEEVCLAFSGLRDDDNSFEIFGYDLKYFVCETEFVRMCRERGKKRTYSLDSPAVIHLLDELEAEGILTRVED